MEQSFKGIIKSIDEFAVTVQFEDGQMLQLPKTAVDGSAQEGSEIRIIAVAPGGEQAGSSAMAKEMLNELMKESYGEKE